MCTVFCIVISHSWIEVHQHVRGMCYLHLAGQSVRQEHSTLTGHAVRQNIFVMCVNSECMCKFDVQ
jgi:hypothetical protein